MKTKDIDNLIRFEDHVSPEDLRLRFGQYGIELYNDIRLHGLLKTFHIMSEENREKMMDLIENF